MESGEQPRFSRTEMESVIQVLVCPVCYGSLSATAPEAEFALLCTKCGLTYPVVDGIPRLLSTAHPRG